MSDGNEQEVVEEVDRLLKEALRHATTYRKHGDARPSALMAFRKINDARQELDAIDDRGWPSDE